MPKAHKLREIFRLETERTLSNDWVVRHENRFYQVEAKSRNHAPEKPVVLPKRPRRRTPPAVNMPDHPWRRGYQDMKALKAPGAESRG